MKRKERFRMMVLSIVLSCISFWSGCKDNSTESESGEAINYDYSYIYKYDSDFNISQFTVVKENKYSKILMIHGYMTDNQIMQLAANVDNVINRICVYLNTDIAKEYNGFKGKVSYFVEPGIIPRYYGGSSVPIVSITNDASLATMYNHETVHIF
jgi:hypothetical protein